MLTNRHIIFHQFNVKHERPVSSMSNSRHWLTWIFFLSKWEKVHSSTLSSLNCAVNRSKTLSYYLITIEQFYYAGNSCRCLKYKRQLSKLKLIIALQCLNLKKKLENLKWWRKKNPESRKKNNLRNLFIKCVAVRLVLKRVSESSFMLLLVRENNSF